ncbi:FAD-dependent oxidoreductase [Paraburkholderia tropica]|uniref:FAD-dependent oxidoreductase n=1 Tax=Paraburkholderia tropica TaxID=92647 RepID=UPI0015901622|nr:FAD-dependent monooxygenase [Paraburkholderia tropica]
MSQSSNKPYGHAVVIGASIAGLLAAATASQTFQRVTLIERDQLDDVAEPRKGVPQGALAHVLLPVGLDRIEMVLPGLREDLLASGASLFDASGDTAVLTSTGWMVRTKGPEWVACRRPIVELCVRRRVQAIQNVEFKGASVGGLAVGESEGRKIVTGVKLRDGSVIEADFVINATGRRTKSIDWLAEHGVSAPRESFVNGYVGYATQYIRLAGNPFKHGVMGIGALPWPGETRGVALYPTDNGLHALTAIGAMRDYPARDSKEVAEFIRSGVCPVVADLIEGAEPVSEVYTYHIDGSLLRHWKEVADLPDRFVTIGDAAASMNPVFGQGMSLSASATMVLKSVLESSETLDGLAKKVHQQVAPILEGAYAVATSFDAAFDGAEWSEDFTPMNDAAKEFGLALQVLSTERADISAVLNSSMSNLRPEELGASFVSEACGEWLKGSRSVAPFDRAEYPQAVYAVSEAEVA